MNKIYQTDISFLYGNNRTNILEDGVIAIYVDSVKIFYSLHTNEINGEVFHRTFESASTLWAK